MEKLKDHVLNLMQAFDTKWPGPSGTTLKLSSKDLELCLDPKDGCRILNLKYKGVEILRQHDASKRAFQYGCFPMIPWVGRMKNGDIHFNGKTYHLYQNKGLNAMHGLAHFRDWQVLEQSDSTLVLCYELKYPWPFKGKIFYKLHIKENTLSLKLKAISDGDIFPASLGWHPWFLKDPMHKGIDCLDVIFNAKTMEEIVDELPTTRRIAVHEGPYDDCFNYDNFDANAILSYKDSFKVKITSNCPALIIFDKQEDATCVNTMTGVPNDVNTDPKLVTPVSPLEAIAKLEFI